MPLVFAVLIILFICVKSSEVSKQADKDLANEEEGMRKTNGVLEQEFDTPFNPENPPVTLTAELVEVEWDFNCGYCDRLPKSTEPIGDIQKIKLIPYGCTNLRMTEIPFVSLEKDYKRSY